jgi:uncharacterized membrane protein YraQ (UPF0718 family)
MFSLILCAVAALALALSWAKDRGRTRKALLGSARAMLNLTPSLLGMTGLVGLGLALVPPDFLANLFRHHGPAGFMLITTVGALITMPAPVAFPLAGSLMKLGVSLSALAAFITTLTMVGVVTAPLEAAYFGKRFTLVRQSLSFGLALLIGLLMGELLP